MATKKELQLKKDIRIYTVILIVSAIVFAASLAAHLWFTYQARNEVCDYKEVSVKVVNVSSATKMVRLHPRTETVVTVRNGRFDMPLHGVTNPGKFINAQYSGEEITVYSYRGKLYPDTEVLRLDSPMNEKRAQAATPMLISAVILVFSIGYLSVSRHRYKKIKLREEEHARKALEAASAPKPIKRPKNIPNAIKEAGKEKQAIIYEE